jgi:hypothetical protein
MNNKGKETVLAISDLQFPFSHRDTFAFLAWVKQKYKPTQVVCMGDEMDFCAISNYDPDPDGMSAGDEFLRGLADMKKLYKLFPNAKSCTSNHTARGFRKAFAAGIPSAFLKGYAELLEAPKGWQWADRWEIDDVVYEHGEGFSGRQGAINCAEKNGKPTVIGHLHSHAGIQYSANEQSLIYGFNTGCLIDRHAYAFRYGKHMRHKPILGVGIIIKGVPQFIPMLLTKDSRWVKR